MDIPVAQTRSFSLIWNLSATAWTGVVLPKTTLISPGLIEFDASKAACVSVNPATSSRSELRFSFSAIDLEIFPIISPDWTG